MMFLNPYKQDLKVVRLPVNKLMDNEIKTNIINAINDYFNIDNWDFGDTFTHRIKQLHTPTSR